MLFAGREPVAAIARGGLEAGADAGWDAIELGGLRMTVEEPLRAWRVAMDAEHHGFDLRFEALTPPAEIDGDEAVARAGGMAGYEQLCGVTGTVRADGREREIRCLGQRGHGWGEPDWSRIESARTLAAWPDAGYGLGSGERAPERHATMPTSSCGRRCSTSGARCASRTRACRRPTTTRAASAAPGSSCGSATTSYPHRGSGEVLCGSTLDLGQLRLDCAFFRWRIDGESGVGRYDVLRRATRASSRCRAGPSSRARGIPPRAPRSGPARATAGRTRAPAPRRRPR